MKGLLIILEVLLLCGKIKDFGYIIKIIVLNKIKMCYNN